MKINNLVGWCKSQIRAMLGDMDTIRVIYAFRDPRDWHVYYVGYTKNLFRRIHYHYRDRKYEKRGGTLSKDWLIELAEIGLMPVSEILEVVEEGVDWEARERFWISTLKEAGEPLLNGTDGGLGGRPSSASQIKRSATMRKTWDSFPPEEKEARRLAIQERYTGNQYTSKDGIAKPGSDAAKLRTGEAAKKFWESASTKRKEQLREVHREGFLKMEANKKRIVLAALDTGRHRKGQRHPWREESRQKVSKASSKYWANKPVEEKMDLVKPMLIARKNAWAALTPEERRTRMAKVWAGQKRRETSG